MRGFRSNLQICPADKIAVGAFVNSDDGDSWLYVDRALEWVGVAIASVTRSAPLTADPAWAATGTPAATSRSSSAEASWS